MEAGRSGFDLSRITGLNPKQATNLYLGQAEVLGSPGALHCGFHWGEDQLFPNVRHVLVRERWLLIVIDYPSQVAGPTDSSTASARGCPSSSRTRR